MTDCWRQSCSSCSADQSACLKWTTPLVPESLNSDFCNNRTAERPVPFVAVADNFHIGSFRMQFESLRVVADNYCQLRNYSVA